ncbi:MAG: ribosome-associated translation inhibitor RaiA [Planctomycetota bacterium]
MRTDIVGRNITVTDTLRGYVEKRTGKLERYLDAVQQVVCTFAKVSESSKTVEAELVVDVEHHPSFVAKAESPTVEAAIDAATDKMSRQLTDFKEKLKLNNR